MFVDLCNLIFLLQQCPGEQLARNEQCYTCRICSILLTHQGRLRIKERIAERLLLVVSNKTRPKCKLLVMRLEVVLLGQESWWYMKKTCDAFVVLAQLYPSFTEGATDLLC